MISNILPLQEPWIQTPTSLERDMEFRHFFETHFEPDGKQLYHYTKQDAFFSILNSKTTWLSHIDYMNDATEHHYAYDFLYKILTERSSYATPLEEALFDRIKAQSFVSYNLMRFVLCFSRKFDDLNQWRSYSSPGNGFCLGFDYKDISAVADHFNGILGRCLYQENAQETAIKNLIEYFSSDLVAYFPAFGPGEINHDLITGRASLFHNYFQKIAPLFKHPAFSEEQEVRMVVSRHNFDSSIRFRSASNSIIPFISLDHSTDLSPPLIPSTVVIKNVSNIDHVIKSTKLFLRSLNYSQTDVTGSRIPFRE